VFKDKGKSNEAISCYEKALAIKPDYAEAYSQLFHQLHNEYGIGKN
jgi:tetratricopeptide (TPR) repeat protein